MHVALLNFASLCTCGRASIYHLVLLSQSVLNLVIAEEHFEELRAARLLPARTITGLEVEQCADHTVGLADNFKVGSDSFPMVGHVARLVLTVSVHIDVQDDLLKYLVLLLVFVHSNQLLEDVLRDDLGSELAGDDRCLQVRNELVFEILLSEEVVDVREKVGNLVDLETELD